MYLKALVNEDTLLRTHCCGHIVADTLLPMMFLGLRKLGNILLRTKNVSEQNQKHFLCPQQMLRGRANGETFVSATICPQKCVLVCQGLKDVGHLLLSKF